MSPCLVAFPKPSTCSYITDDGSQVALFKFVADAAGDLSSGEGAWGLLLGRAAGQLRGRLCAAHGARGLGGRGGEGGAAPVQASACKRWLAARLLRPRCTGTLYGAKATQTSADNGGEFSIEWIELGSHTQDEVKVRFRVLWWRCPQYRAAYPAAHFVALPNFPVCCRPLGRPSSTAASSSPTSLRRRLP